MKQMEVQYLGDLRTQGTHLKSGIKIMTDAPLDNDGKGEAFSPTDLTSFSLASCIITTMGIQAGKNGWNIDGIQAEVENHEHNSSKKDSRDKSKADIPGFGSQRR